MMISPSFQNVFPGTCKFAMSRSQAPLPVRNAHWQRSELGLTFSRPVNESKVKHALTLKILHASLGLLVFLFCACHPCRPGRSSSSGRLKGRCLLNQVMAHPLKCSDRLRCWFPLENLTKAFISCGTSSATSSESCSGTCSPTCSGTCPGTCSGTCSRTCPVTCSDLLRGLRSSLWPKTPKLRYWGKTTTEGMGIYLSFYLYCICKSFSHQALDYV